MRQLRLLFLALIGICLLGVSFAGEASHPPPIDREVFEQLNRPGLLEPRVKIAKTVAASPERFHSTSLMMAGAIIFVSGDLPTGRFLFRAGELRAMHYSLFDNTRDTAQLLSTIRRSFGEPLATDAYRYVRTTRLSVERVLQWDRDTSNGELAAHLDVKADRERIAAQSCWYLVPFLTADIAAGQLTRESYAGDADKFGTDLEADFTLRTRLPGPDEDLAKWLKARNQLKDDGPYPRMSKRQADVLADAKQEVVATSYGNDAAAIERASKDDPLSVCGQITRELRRRLSGAPAN